MEMWEMLDDKSLTVSAYRSIRSDILAGRLEPGRKLRIQELVDRLEVSPSVVREALSRLSAETLVVAEPQRGFRVSPINAEDVSDLTDVRVDIEMKCLRQAIKNGDLAWEEEIVAANHALGRTPYQAHEISDEWSEAHARFHVALVAACNSPWLLRIREQLFAQAERYRRINIRTSSSNRDVVEEHAKIANAVLNRDIDLAMELMTAHLRATEIHTLESLRSQKAKA
jgi:DNA-binding GntR family transcriptional regulator